MADESLPNADRATLAIEKLTDYALNPDHPDGRHKARVFASALGYTRDNAEELRRQILDLVPNGCVARKRPSMAGTAYEVPLLVTGPNGRQHWVTTAWAGRENEAPRLVTLYVDLP